MWIVLQELTLLFFALNHVNYSRRMPAVRIRDELLALSMISLRSFSLGPFQDHSQLILCDPYDKAHEQKDKIVKDSGEAFRLTEHLLFLLVMDALRTRYWLLKQLQEESFLENVRDILLEISPSYRWSVSQMPPDEWAILIGLFFRLHVHR